MNAFNRTAALSLSWLAAACLIFAVGTAPARSAVPLPERVQVSWAPNDQLSEVKDNPSWRGWLKPADWQKSLSEHLRKRADRVLPPGQQLVVTVNDIKLAGDYEPWRGPNLQDVRFMKDLYPPRMDLHYKLVAADGSTIREGDSKLRDMAYLQHSVPFENDPLRFDKRMLDDWLTKEFARNPS
jgi:Protein of unknown function (DUF3016)